MGFEVEPMSLAEGDYRMAFDKTKAGLQVLKAGEVFRFTYEIRTVVSKFYV